MTGLLVGRTGPKDVHGAARAVDLYDAKADAEAILERTGLEVLSKPFDLEDLRRKVLSRLIARKPGA